MLEEVGSLLEEGVASTEGQEELREGEEASVVAREVLLEVLVGAVASLEDEAAQASREEPTPPHGAEEGTSQTFTEGVHTSLHGVRNTLGWYVMNGEQCRSRKAWSTQRDHGVATVAICDYCYVIWSWSCTRYYYPVRCLGFLCLNATILRHRRACAV